MHNPLATFIYDADNVTSVKFNTQYDDETVKLFLRRHAVTNLSWMLPVIILSVPALIVMLHPEIAFDLLEPVGLKTLVNVSELRTVVLVYLLGLSYYAIMNFLRWYFDVLIVTNKRIIDISLRPPFNWQVTQAQLEEVQDVRHTQGGISGILFNMGNIYVQTAGTAQNIAIRKVPKPNRVHELIIQMLP